MVTITGIGWINEYEYGCVLNDLRIAYQDRAHLKKEIFTTSSRNFGRIDNASKVTCYAAALALRDAGIEYSPEHKQDMGIIGTNKMGSLETDMNYFKDYLDSGRTSSRGNLFIYTLPTSPLGEAAIRFGMQGPLLYVANEDDSLMPVIDTAKEIVDRDEAPLMLAGITRVDEAVYFVLEKESGPARRILCDMSDAVPVLKKDLTFNEMIKEFSLLRKGMNRS